MRNITLAIIALLMCGSAFAKQKTISLKIIETSDVHGSFFPYDFANRQPRQGSMARVSSYVNRQRKAGNLVLLDNGDILQGQPTSYFYNYVAINDSNIAANVINYMKYDVFVLGNHEFNFGMPALNNILKDMKSKKITANFYNNNGKRYLPPTTIIEKDGVKIGIIGITTPMSAKFEEDTGHLKNYKFTSPIEETKKQVYELKKKGVNAIVVVAHMGIENENNIPDTGVRDLVNSVDGIDVIIAGHMHLNVKKEIINGVLITEPHRYGTVLSEVDLKFSVNEKEVKLLDKNSTTIPVNKKEPDIDIVVQKPKVSRLEDSVFGEFN